MAINYTVLKSSIIHSSIWLEDSDTRIVWLTLLAMRNKDGEVYASLKGLAHAARVDVKKTGVAIAKFLLPEDDSSHKDFEGRRIAEIPGGWKLLNHERVKAEALAANKAVYMKGYMKEQREKEGKPKSNPMLKNNASLPSGKEIRHLKEHADGKRSDDELADET